MKYLIIGDIHFGEKQNNRDFLDIHTKLFQEFIFPKFKEHNCDAIIVLGDTFHSRFTTNNYLMTETTNKFFNWFNDNKIKGYFIMGNHDMFHKTETTHSPLFSFQSEYIKIVDKAVVLNKKIGLVPYSFTKIPGPSKVKHIMGHFNIKGFKMGGKVCDDGIDPVDYVEYENFISGHFHSFQEGGNVIMLGSVCQFSFKEFGAVPTLLTLDDETGEKEYIENNFSPIHVRCYCNEVDGKFKFRYDKGYRGVKPDIFTYEEFKKEQSLTNNYVNLIVETCNDDDFITKVRKEVNNIIEPVEFRNKLVLDDDAVDLESVESVPEIFSKCLEEGIIQPPVGISVDEAVEKFTQYHELAVEEQ